MKTAARFEHVSSAQYAADTNNMTVLPLEEIPLPRRATAGSAGYDFVSSLTVTMQPGESALIPTGIRACIQPGWVLLLFPRSSLGFKHNVRLSNTVGVVDSDYYDAKNEGHIHLKLFNAGDHTVTIQAGERFCQGVFVPYGIAEGDDTDAGRVGGMGSTGV